MISKKALLLVVSISVLASLLLIGREEFVSLITNPDPTKVSIDELRRELEAVNIPVDHMPDDPIKTFDRGIATGATRHFRAQYSDGEIIEFYRASLRKQGWVLANERRISGNEIALKFCKKSMSLTLDLVSEAPESAYYYLGVLWVSSKSDRAYCRK